MSFTLAVNEVNDLFLGTDGNLSTASGADAVAFAAGHAAKTQLAEMIYDTDAGLPNFETVWVGVPNVPVWEAALRATLLAVDGVQRIDSLTVTRGDALTYSARIQTIYGTAVLNG